MDRWPRILVVGAPRSGTTWVAEALSRGGNAPYVHEPDNERFAPLAIRAKQGLGRFPVLLPHQVADVYESLWARAFNAGKPKPYLADRLARALLKSTPASAREATGERNATPPPKLRVAARLAASEAALAEGPAVIKSVHCMFAADWLLARWQPTVLLVVRHPLNVLASYRDLGMRDQDRGLDALTDVREKLVEPRALFLPHRGASSLQRSAWQLGLFMTVLLEAADQHGWITVRHEVLCSDPRPLFASLGRDLGLGWHRSGDVFLHDSNQPGGGFATNRVASQLEERWKRTLSEEDASQIRRVLERFPRVAAWLEMIARPDAITN